MIYYFSSLTSTNDKLRTIAKNNAKNLTLVWTKNQTEGKGSQGNRWLSESNQNLTFSFLLIHELSPRYFGIVSMWVANVLQVFLAREISDIQVKWPNDLIVKKKKICGILIENQRVNGKHQMIVGIGLNVNQTRFDKLHRATSIKNQTKKDYVLEDLLTDLLADFKSRTSELDSKYFSQIIEQYNRNLFKKDKVSAFRIQDKVQNGMIQKVDEKGILWVLLEGDAQESFLPKEIELLY